MYTTVVQTQGHSAIARIQERYSKTSLNNMSGIGCGHLLLRIAQQYLCEYIEHKESYTIYLFANPNLVTDHYEKLGFRSLGEVEKNIHNAVYKTASEKFEKMFPTRRRL